MGHNLEDSRHGLIANAMVSAAAGYEERETVKVMHQRCKAGAKNENAELCWVLTMTACNLPRVRSLGEDPSTVGVKYKQCGETKRERE